MTLVSIGAAALIAIGGARPRNSSRRGSVEAGTFEREFFVAPAKGETNKVLRAAKQLSAERPTLRAKLADRGRRPSRIERLILLLNRNAVAVLEELLELARTQAGKVYPSYEWLRARTGISRATVARALVILEGLGFITRQRRFKRVEAEGVGPRYKQTSNAYRIHLPDRLLGFLPGWMRPAPIPVDAEDRAAADRDATVAMLDSLTHRELAEVTISGPLGQALARLGARLDLVESESHICTGPLVKFIGRR